MYPGPFIPTIVGNSTCMKGDSHVIMKVSEFEHDARQYADTDLSNAIGQLRSKHNITASYNITNVTTVEKEAYTSSYVSAAVSIKGTSVPININYVKDLDDGEVYVYVFDSNNRLSEYCYDEIDKLVVDAASQLRNKKSILAADDDDFDSMVAESDDIVDDTEGDTEDDPEVRDDVSIQDTLQDMSDTLEDMQNDVDKMDPDLVDIELNNNIADHYIAECSVCHGVFISAVVKSDAEIDNVHGICPLCNREADQLLKWLIVKADSSANHR